jgi:hypothetical protein
LVAAYGIAVLATPVPLGVWLALTRPAPAENPARQARLIQAPVLALLAAAVGCVGGIYGIGGGSILGDSLSAPRLRTRTSGCSGSAGSVRWSARAEGYRNPAHPRRRA